MRGLTQAVEPMEMDNPDVGNVERQESFVVENSTLDLDAYSSTYTGLTKLQRLIFIANHCRSYAVDALRKAASAVKTTHNTKLYVEIMTSLSTFLSAEEDDSAPGQQTQVDNHWVETTDKRAEIKLDKLDQDLKTYKNSSIKESIRRGQDDLGDVFLDCGDLVNAMKCYSRARDYCICGQHILQMCLNVIKVSVLLQNWAHVLTYVRKAESVPDLKESVNSTSPHNERQKKATNTVIAKLKAAQGLAELSQSQYKNAALSFLVVSFDYLDFNEVIGAQDVAIYGGLCALATFDREELQKKVLANSSFKQFLELHPPLREILHKFYASKYAVCFNLLVKMKENLMLDMYLSPHVTKLYEMVRNRALVQYFIPYVSADLHKMAESFNTSIESLEDELTTLILEGLINARIDSSKKILYARDVNHRNSTFEKVLRAGKEYEQRTKALMLRTVVLQHQIYVKPPQ